MAAFGADLLVHYAALFHASPEATVTVGLDGSIAAWNPAAERLYAHASEHVRGRPLSTVIPDE